MMTDLKTGHLHSTCINCNSLVCRRGCGTPRSLALNLMGNFLKRYSTMIDIIKRYKSVRLANLQLDLEPCEQDYF